MLSSCRARITPNTRYLQFILNKQSSLCLPQVRLLSTKNIFGNVDLTNSENLLNIPSIPVPRAIKQSVQEMHDAGLSVINELELFSWWKPSGYFRYALEYIHLHLDVPWWATIICGECFLLNF